MKALNLAATCVFGGVLIIAGIALAGQEKVDVCHITGMFDFGSGDVPVGHVILIADPAYPAHLEHGDPDAYTLVYDADGNEYCTAQVEPPPTYACDAYTEGNFSLALGLIDSVPDNFVGLVDTCRGWEYSFFYALLDPDGWEYIDPPPYINIIDQYTQIDCTAELILSYISLCTTDAWCETPLLYGCSRFPNDPNWEACAPADDLALATCADELRTHIAGLLP